MFLPEIFKSHFAESSWLRTGRVYATRRKNKTLLKFTSLKSFYVKCERYMPEGPDLLRISRYEIQSMSGHIAVVSAEDDLPMESKGN
jgi:hypothetical protein